MDLSLSTQMISCLKMQTEIKLWRGSDAMSLFCHSGFNLASQTITADLLDVYFFELVFLLLAKPIGSMYGIYLYTYIWSIFMR